MTTGNLLIHPGDDHRPRERCVGYGIPYTDGCLCVSCGTCKAPEGAPCTRRGGGSHTARWRKAGNRINGHAYRLFLRRETEALRSDPNAQLWSFQSLPHRCGTLGAHVLTDCTEPTP